MCKGYATAQEAYDRQEPSETAIPICHQCGRETDTYYKYRGQIIGCDNCIKSVDAWEEQNG